MTKVESFRELVEQLMDDGFTVKELLKLKNATAFFHSWLDDQIINKINAYMEGAPIDLTIPTSD